VETERYFLCKTGNDSETRNGNEGGVFGVVRFLRSVPLGGAPSFFAMNRTKEVRVRLAVLITVATMGDDVFHRH
jgi:hypothetical protein